MRIALIGGHGKVALLTEPLLARAGHEVRAVIRNPDHAQDVVDAGAEPVVADVAALDIDALTELLAGHDVVIWSAGAGGGDPERTYAVDREAAIRSIDAAEQAGVARYVMVSYFGAGLDHGVPEDNPFHAYAEAKAVADEHLRRSGLGWTVLGPSALTMDNPTGHIEVRDDLTTGREVARADVARVIAEVVGRPELAGRTIEFNNGAVPIEDALAELTR